MSRPGIAFAVLAGLALSAASPALAQHDHGGHDHAAPPAEPPPPAESDPHAGHGMPMDQPMATHAPADPHAGHIMPTGQQMAAPVHADPHAGHMMHHAPAADPDGSHGMDGGHSASAPNAPQGQEIGNAAPPALPTDHAADALFDPAEMARQRLALRQGHGGFSTAMILIELAEYQARKNGDGYRWQGEAWFGGDINRLLVKAEGEGSFGRSPEETELQLLYARAIAPYWNVQLGLRHDFTPDPSRSYAVLGIEGMAPYWFHLSGQIFLSDKGDLRLRAEGSHDLRITQKLILAPRAELNFSARDMPQIGIGSGLSDAELGLRMRYEISRQFAPYVGIEWSAKAGGTARYARAAGEDVHTTNLVAGIRFWF